MAAIMANQEVLLYDNLISLKTYKSNVSTLLINLFKLFIADYYIACSTSHITIQNAVGFAIVQILGVVTIQEDGHSIARFRTKGQ